MFSWHCGESKVSILLLLDTLKLEYTVHLRTSTPSQHCLPANYREITGSLIPRRPEEMNRQAHSASDQDMTQRAHDDVIQN